MAKDDRFLEFVSAHALQSVADTDLQVAFDIPTSETELLAFLIHRIDWEGNVPVGIAAAAIGIDGYLTTTIATPAGLGTHINWPSLVDCYMRMARYGTTTDDQLESDLGDQHRIHHFDPPILIAQRTLYLTIHTSASTVVNDVAIRLGYTLEKVSREAFIAALVAHH